MKFLSSKNRKATFAHLNLARLCGEQTRLSIRIGKNVDADGGRYAYSGRAFPDRPGVLGLAVQVFRLLGAKAWPESTSSSRRTKSL